MINMKRNQIIITALSVMIAVAGYLNYVDSKNGVHTSNVLSQSDELGTSLIVDDLGNIDKLTNFEVVEGDNINNINEIAIAETSSNNIETTKAATDIQTNEVDNINSIDEMEDAGTAIFVNSNVDSFFVQAKLVREQDRSKQREILTDMINNENLTADQKSTYADEMLNIQKRIEKESSAEAMIEAKGFKDVYVRIDNETVDVVVGKEVLTDSEIAQIEDIVRRKTGMDATQIRISPMKP